MKRLMKKIFSHRQSDHLRLSSHSTGVAVADTHSAVAVRNSSEPRTAIQRPNSTDVFLSEDALAINEARLCHLASLGLDIAGKKVLEVGGGIGLHTCFFESLGCDVLFTEARPENLAAALKRTPHRKSMLLNLDLESDLSHLGRFDIVYCYGTLYHYENQRRRLRRSPRFVMV